MKFMKRLLLTITTVALMAALATLLVGDKLPNVPRTVSA
jgi:hypothetical protein